MAPGRHCCQYTDESDPRNHWGVSITIEACKVGSMFGGTVSRALARASRVGAYGTRQGPEPMTTGTIWMSRWCPSTLGDRTQTRDPLTVSTAVGAARLLCGASDGGPTAIRAIAAEPLSTGPTVSAERGERASVQPDPPPSPAPATPRSLLNMRYSHTRRNTTPLRRVR
jgi:hypothetical protein